MFPPPPPSPSSPASPDMDPEQGPKDASSNITKKLNGIEFKEVNLTSLMNHLCTGQSQHNGNKLSFSGLKGEHFCASFNVHYCILTRKSLRYRDVVWRPRITSVTSGGKPKWWRWIRREMKSLSISLVKNNSFDVTLDLTFYIDSGWNGRHDEWIRMDSPRLQPLHRRSR